MVSTRAQQMKEEPKDVPTTMNTSEPGTGHLILSDEKLRQMVKDAENAFPQDANETWYIISAKWFKQLKVHLAEGAGNEITNPGSVDNSDIVVKFDEQNELRDQAVEKADYEIIPVKLWDALVSKYGAGTPDPVLAVQSYENQFGEVKMEVRPLALNCLLYPNFSNITPLHVSRSMAIEDCIHILLSKFDVSTKDIIRFWVFAPNGTLDKPDPDGKKPIGSLDLTIKHYIVVERTVENGWDLDITKNHEKLISDLKKQQRDDEGVHVGEKKIIAYNLRSNQGSRENSMSRGGSLTSSATPHGLVGLGNLGNTCFMNSSLQCLSNVPELKDYFVSERFKDDINVTNPLGKKGEIAKAFADLMSELWSSSAKGSVYPTDFKRTLSKHTSLFNGAQQDAQESLQYIVDNLHEDLNRIKNKPYVPDTDEQTPVKSDNERAAAAWEKYRARDDSMIVDLFYGQIKSSVKCPDCQKISVTFDPSAYYALPLPTNELKKFSYTFVPYEIDKSPSRHKVIINKNGDTGAFLKKVAEQLSVPADTLMAMTIYEYRATVIKRDKSLDELGDRDKIFVYGTKKPVDDRSFVTVVIYIRKYKQNSKAYNSALSNNGHLVDYPLVLSLPSKGIPAKMLYHMVYVKLGSRLQAPSDVDSVDVGDSNDDKAQDPEIDGENGVEEQHDTSDVKMEMDDAEMPAGIGAFVPPVFTISTVNAYGNIENKKVKNAPGERVNFLANRDEHYISVNFTESKYNKYYRPSDMPVNEEISGFHRRAVESDVVDLRDCFQLYISPERLTGNNLWRCPQCKEEKPAMKKLDLWRMPKYMFVLLKRFQYTRFYREKLSTKVRFPVKDLDLSDLIENPEDSNVLYDLVAVSCHSGGLGGGHYWAVCKNHENNEWYKFDDSHVHRASEFDIENETNPYILVFKRQSKEEDEKMEE